MAQAIVPAMAVTAPEGGLGAAAAVGGGWFLAAAGFGFLVYAAYKCGRIIYRWSDMSQHGCGNARQALATAAREEIEETFASIRALLQRLGLRGQDNQELQDQLEAARNALITANNRAAILEAQLEAERRARERAEARLDIVENDNRELRNELTDVKENVNYLMRVMARLPVQDTNQ